MRKLNLFILFLVLVVGLSGCTLKKVSIEKEDPSMQPQDIVENNEDTTVEDEIDNIDNKQVELNLVDHIDGKIEPFALVGGWTVQGADFEEILIEDVGTYSTFLHDRPFETGEWSFNADGDIILESDVRDDALAEQSLMVLSYEGDVLTLNDGKAEFIWTRIK